MMDKKWLPKAFLLGLVFFLAALIMKPIGVSTQFSMFSGLVHSKIDTQIIQESENASGQWTSSNAYYAKSKGSLIKSMQNPINYDFIFVLAIPAGAYLASTFKKRDDEYEAQQALEKQSSVSPLKHFLTGAVGGALILYGSRMADGCTSGHMMAGMSQSSVSGYVFAVAVFAAAIPTALIVKKLSQGGKDHD